MNILIFDDDISTVQMLKSTIDWNELNIGTVYTVYRIDQAKDVFSRERHIDIMLCDIEAPGGTGIDLLRWVRENSYDTENIFLTNHAEFDYAKEAIQLGCVDYIMKTSPLSVIREAIKKAINKVKLNNIILQHKFYEEYWAENHNIVTEQFWKEMLLYNAGMDRSKTENMVVKRKVDVNINTDYLIILISYMRYQNLKTNLDDSSYRFVIKNIAQQIILDNVESSNIIFIEKGTKTYLSIILDISQVDKVGADNLKRNCSTFISFCNTNLESNANCYYGRFVKCEETGMLEKELEDIDIDNVCTINRVISIEGYVSGRKKNDHSQPDMAEWADMLRNEKSTQLFISVKDYIEETAKVLDIDAAFMNDFQQDFLQVLFSVLEEEHVQAHKLFSDEISKQLSNHAVNSLYDMLKWVDFSINKAFDCINEVRRIKTVIDKIKEFIESNYNRSISRIEIANKFFLNPDYISRVFNKETGLSIPEYQTKLRVNKAMQLLKSGAAISEVAVLVGYDNFSYFSTVYKKIVGVAPAKFRKKYQ